MNKKYALKTALLGILCAQALALNFIEGLIPALPFLPPGAKPGLSNIIVMFVASNMDLPSALIVSLVKSGFVFITRGVAAGFMSLSGGLLSAISMYLLMHFHSDKLGIVGISVISSLFHNAGQLFASAFITGSSKTLYYAPALIIFGTVTGIITGIIFRAVLPVLNKQKNHFFNLK